MSGSGLRERVVETRRRGRRLTTIAGLLLLLCSAWQAAICGEYFRRQSLFARSGYFPAMASSWPMLDLLAVSTLASFAAVLVGVAVALRRGPLRWAGPPVALLLAWAGLRWQLRDIGVRPMAFDFPVDGSGSLRSTVLLAGVLALAVIASVVVSFAGGLVTGGWRWVALAAVAAAALGALLMQAVPTGVPTPGTAVAMFALSLAEPIALAALGITSAFGVRPAPAPTSSRRASSSVRSLPVG